MSKGLFEQATKPLVERKVVHPEILELCRELKLQLKELRGLERARCAMDLSLPIYCTTNLGRAEEFFNLRIFSSQMSSRSYLSIEKCSALLFPKEKHFHQWGNDGI